MLATAKSGPPLVEKREEQVRESRFLFTLFRGALAVHICMPGCFYRRTKVAIKKFIAVERTVRRIAPLALERLPSLLLPGPLRCERFFRGLLPLGPLLHKAVIHSDGWIWVSIKLYAKHAGCFVIMGCEPVLMVTCAFSCRPFRKVTS